MMDVEHHCQQIDGLLPWFVNRSLHDRDVEIVRAHLEDCERCRGEAEWLAQLGSHLRGSRMKPVSSAPVAGLRQRIAADRKDRQITGFALAAGLLLALATTLGVVMTWQPFAPRYHTVTDPVPPATGIVTMEFELAPQAPLSSLYGILEKYDATIAAGPDARGNITLEFRLADGESANSLVNALRNDPQVARTARIRPPERRE